MFLISGLSVTLPVGVVRHTRSCTQSIALFTIHAVVEACTADRCSFSRRSGRIEHQNVEILSKFQKLLLLYDVSIIIVHNKEDSRVLVNRMLAKEHLRIGPCVLVCIQRFQRYMSTNYANQQEAANNNNSNDADSDSDINQSHYNSSSHYRRSNRKSYEQKKSYFQANVNTLDGESNNIESLNHYQRLNVEVDAEPSEIKSAYYSLSKVYHPDIVGSSASQADNFRLITESYDLLSDPKRRAEYDRELNIARELDLSQFSDWVPSGGSNRSEQDNLMRNRMAADMIYRMRREASALEQERRRNPRKFRAGAFGGSNTYEYSRTEELNKLNNRLNDIDNQLKARDDAAHFYKSHMRDNLIRRRMELQDAYMKQKDTKTRKSIAKEDEINAPKELGSIVSFGLTLGLIFSVIVGGLFWSMGTNIAGKLDDSYKAYRERKREEARKKKALSSMSAINTT